jgi:hypothetical protein
LTIPLSSSVFIVVWRLAFGARRSDHDQAERRAPIA